MISSVVPVNCPSTRCNNHESQRGLIGARTGPGPGLKGRVRHAWVDQNVVALSFVRLWFPAPAVNGSGALGARRGGLRHRPGGDKCREATAWRRGLGRYRRGRGAGASHRAIGLSRTPPTIKEAATTIIFI